jgi:hypothetical protein
MTFQTLLLKHQQWLENTAFTGVHERGSKFRERLGALIMSVLIFHNQNERPVHGYKSPASTIQLLLTATANCLLPLPFHLRSYLQCPGRVYNATGF